MNRFSSNYILPVIGSPIRNGVITLDDSGYITEIIKHEEEVQEYPFTEFYNGVIVPGFVNTHCHLELSHLKGVFKKSTGIAGFLSQIRNLRKAESGYVLKAIKSAIYDLKKSGVVAVGDICNTTDTISLKKGSDILFHSFIEQFGVSDEIATDRFSYSRKVLEEFKALQFHSSITPHSTYSISEKLWSLLSEELKLSRDLVSIHYGESKQEYLLLKEHSGPLAEEYVEMGVPVNLPSCASPLEIVQKYIPKESNVLFVHNTFISKEEIAKLKASYNDSTFVICPSSNLFIESALPDIPMMINAGASIAIGTDSYASSDTLSVFDQIMIILDHFPGLSFNEVLNWATINGAKALNFDSLVGSIEIGKKPGLNLITNFDFKNMRPTLKSRVRPLV